jgi:hypothetical protein
MRSTMRDFVMNPEPLPKPYWYNITTSIIAQVLLAWLKAGYFFGRSESDSLGTAGYLAMTYFGTLSTAKSSPWLYFN